MRPATDLASVVFARRELLLSLLLEFHRSFGHSIPSLLLERSAHELQKLAALFVRLSRCYEANVHAADLVDLVVLDLGENELLLNAQAVVASAVECVGLMPRKSRTRGSATLNRRSMNSHILSPRRVTFTPIGMPSRSLKFATDFFALQTTGF